MSNYYVRVIETETGEEIKNLGPMSEGKADKVELGLLRNMNRDKFHTAITVDLRCKKHRGSKSE